MTEQTKSFHLYPLFMKLEGRPCLVVGGGSVAERKINGLLDAGAAVTVISPEATDRIQMLSQTNHVLWQRKTFAATDLKGEFLAVAATDDQSINSSIAAVCRARGILVNVADEPELCDYIVPAVLRRGALCIAVSTEGKSPVLAQKLRSEIEQIITAPYAEFLDLLGQQREIIKQVPDAEKREVIFHALVYSDILDLLAAGKHDQAMERIKECISSQLG